jgi:hypothetical protein
MPAAPADIPVTAALLHHRLEVALLDAVGAANRPRFGYNLHRYSDTAARMHQASAKMRQLAALHRGGS